jgi:pilus assembly protein CpaF
MSAINTLVSEAIDVVVHTERTATGPRLTGIIAVEDLAGGADATQFTVTELFEADSTGALRWTGLVPQRLAAAFRRSGDDLRRVLDRDGTLRDGDAA